MLTIEKDNKEATNKWWAAQDARMRNIANKSRWDTKTHRKVDAMMAVLDTLYSGKIHEAYRVRSVAIKIDKPQVRDRKWLAVMEADWAAEGIYKTQTPQGILYQVRKVVK